ncbi:thiamine pyrophosphate-binding protein [Tardiphaga sp.]|uniref:thiamine pyrophosphate-binding protein n=1 Tax=Tardiphaga sp. TaxID=1926292 RepID=UPI0026269964|nr:thiamine pyrophosphate-binding protein [Tardiphaga sp.]MDB5619764.1 putative acetolactate synthase large subunit [Tardiphaga sp.]
MTIKLSDWVAQKLVDEGIQHVFMVTGGGAMHLNHSLGSHSELECVFNHHEQACAMAAESYFRVNNKLAVVNVTSGPGGTNAITGIYGAYADSIGCVVLSGQVKLETTVQSTGMPLRQYGDQELDIEKMIRPITKYSVMLTDPTTIRYHLEKALYLAKTGRPGPCWLDIPLDIQAARIDPDALAGFDPAELNEPWKGRDLTADCDIILDRLAKAERPVIYAGNGINLSGQQAAFLKLVDKLGIPVVTGFNAHDTIWNEHPCHAGRPGTIGDRAGNFVAQNSDCLLILGTRLNIRQISYNWKSFARQAFKIWVDVDGLELARPNIQADMPVVADLKDLIPALAARPYPGATDGHKSWLAWAVERKTRFPVVLEEYWTNKVVNPYCFMDSLFDNLPEGRIVVAANATACITSFQASKLKPGQRLWSNSGAASMGYDLPAAIGACKASGDQPIICLAGDGSIMMNLQELQTIVSNQMPIKIFLLNNSGYVSIFQTQRNFFKGDEIGAGPKSGVQFPNFEPLMKAFGLPYVRCNRHDDLASSIQATLAANGPAVCEVILDENQPFAPKLSSKQMPDGTIVSPELEDMAPFLSREELAENMLIK